MSDLLTHWAVFDDCRLLMAGDPEVDPVLQRVLEEQKEYGRLGAITRDGNSITPELLPSIRERWDSAVETDRLPAKLGFILGSLLHQSCDNAMKPLISIVAGGNWERAHRDMWVDAPGSAERYVPHNLISAYYDTYILKKVYIEPNLQAFDDQFMADFDKDGPIAATESIVRSMFQRALLSSHTLKPDLSDPERWLEDTFEAYQALYVDVATFAKVYHNPDPELMVKYRVESDFYSADDPIISIAARLRHGGSPVTDEERKLLTLEANGSSYGTALALGLAYLHSGSAVWTGKTDQLEAPNWDEEAFVTQEGIN